MLKAKSLLIDQYNLKKLGYDFMGYTLQKGDIFTYHHLIVEAKNGGNNSPENGAILCGKTSHPYLHLIEKYERQRFNLITNEIIKMKEKGYLDFENFKKIHELLCIFEEKFGEEENDIGALIIKPKYKVRIFSNSK